MEILIGTVATHGIQYSELRPGARGSERLLFTCTRRNRSKRMLDPNKFIACNIYYMYTCDLFEKILSKPRERVTLGDHRYTYECTSGRSCHTRYLF